jgi:hypothetical protein
MKKTITIRINVQLQKLCDLLETTPEQVLQTFANDLSMDYQYTSGIDERRMAVEYFIRVGYGMRLFSVEELERVFDELNAIRPEFCHYGNSNKASYMRYRYQAYKKLFERWQARKEQKEH